MIRIQGTLSDIEATILNCVIDPSAINIEFKNIEFNAKSIIDSKGRVFEKVKRGKWIGCSDGTCLCSRCLETNEPTNYCPNCGADMRGGEDE